MQTRTPSSGFAFLLLSLFVSSLLSVGCQTTPKNTVVGETGSAQGQWRGNALVRNRSTGKSGTLTLDVLAHEPSQLRMEIVGSFGVHVASIALNNNEVRAILSREKRFVIAPAGADALIGLVPIRIPPNALLAILFDRQLPTEDWSCDGKKGDPTTVTTCSHKHEPVKVDWLDRAENKRRLKISAAEADIELLLQESPTRVEMKPESFVLEAPEGYKKQIRN